MVKVQNKRAAFDMAWTVVTIVLCVFAAGTFGFLYTATNISEEFFLVYGMLGAISLILLIFFAIIEWGAKFYRGFDREASTWLFLADDSKARFLSHPLARFLSVTVVCIAVVATVTVAGSLVGVPNPYSSEPLSASILNENSLLVSVFSISFYAGLFEEAVVFAINSVIIFAIMFSLRRVKKGLESNPFVFAFVSAFVTAIGAFIFTIAHARAYGLNDQAFLSAFFFSWIVQFLNQITGLFVSWIPHMLNNGIVVFSSETTFAIGGSLAMFLIWRLKGYAPKSTV